MNTLEQQDGDVRLGETKVKAGARRVSQALGTDVMKQLHAQNMFLDLVGVVGWPVVCLVLGMVLVYLPFGWVWLGVFLLQGFVLQALAYVAHDICVHREAFGRSASPVVASLLVLPLLMEGEIYAVSHHAHHRTIGTSVDTEIYKEDLNTRWVRWFALTAPGALLLMAGRLRRSQRPTADLAPLLARPGVASRVARGRVVLVCFVLVVGVTAVLWPSWVLPGYLLPLLLVGPFANAVRMILEHGEREPGHDLHHSTNYRSGLVTQLLFFFQGGDAHLVHHLFPRIPYYRMRAALRSIRPVLEANGLVARRSLLELLVGWFLRHEPHGQRWSHW